MTKITTAQVYDYITELTNEQIKIAQENRDVSEALKAVRVAAILIKINLFIATGKK